MRWESLQEKITPNELFHHVDKCEPRYCYQPNVSFTKQHAYKMDGIHRNNDRNDRRTQPAGHERYTNDCMGDMDFLNLVTWIKSCVI